MKTVESCSRFKWAHLVPVIILLEHVLHVLREWESPLHVRDKVRDIAGQEYDWSDHLKIENWKSRSIIFS